MLTATEWLEGAAFVFVCLLVLAGAVAWLMPRSKTLPAPDTVDYRNAVARRDWANRYGLRGDA